MAPPTNDVPALTQSRAGATPLPLRRSIALRLVDLAILLLRAAAILLLLSPFFLLLVWLSNQGR
jgi:hypothetical protein